jgi:hypothetical protein
MTDRNTGDTPELERAVDTLIDIGRMWATHGLRVGRGALETSARTLEATASALGDIATRLESKLDPK